MSEPKPNQKMGNGNQLDTAEPQKNRKTSGKWVNTFKGETADMNGNVFQLKSEKDKKGQF